MLVTAIEKQRRNGRLNLYVDGAFALGLPDHLVASAGLRAGQRLDGAGLAALREQAARADAMSAALRLLSYRPRSEAELRQRLSRRGAPAELIEATLGRLRELGLADDEAFARCWAESRDRASPRSRRLVERELRAKGVAAETAKQAVAALDDVDGAARAAARRLSRLRRLPREQFRRRLGDYLRRRGFGYEAVRQAVEQSWPDLATAAGA